jgi:hypothetical protein
MTTHTLPPVYVRYTGVFDFDALYATIVTWCKDKGYEWQEETFKHKVPNSEGAEQELKWIAQKIVTDYIQHKIKMAVHIWEITEVESKKKKKLTKARFELIIVGSLITDWQKKWGKSKFSKFLGKVYEERIIRREIEGVYADNLWYRLWDLHAVIKKFFGMQTKAHEFKRYLKED